MFAQKHNSGRLVLSSEQWLITWTVAASLTIFEEFVLEKGLVHEQSKEYTWD